MAVLALGRAWTLLGGKKNSKPEKCLKMPHAKRPTRQVLARFVGTLFALCVT